MKTLKDGLKNWILVDGKAKEVDLLTWGRWLATSKERFIARTEDSKGNFVSTVFLPADENFPFEGPPLLWESQFFRKLTRKENKNQKSSYPLLRGFEPLEESIERYSSHQAALTGHQRMVKKYLKPPYKHIDMALDPYPHPFKKPVSTKKQKTA